MYQFIIMIILFSANANGDDSSFLNPLRIKLGIPLKGRGQDFSFQTEKDKNGKFYIIKTYGPKEKKKLKKSEKGSDFTNGQENIEEGTVKRETISKNEVDKKLKSIVISSILITKKENANEPLKICAPPSLKAWKRMKGINDTERTTKNIFGDYTCDVKVPELNEGRKEMYRSTKGKLSAWKKLDRNLQKDLKLVSPYTKGVRPPTMSTKFCDASRKFAKKYLLPEKNFINLVALIEFFQAHPNVNEVLLDYAVTKTIFSREDLSNDIPSPVIIDDVFFKDSQPPPPNETKLVNGNRGIRIPKGRIDLTSTLEAELTSDSVESKLDYYREDSMYHVFHSLFHKIHNALPLNYTRTYELFWYTHQQMLRRYEIERFSMNMKPVIPLEPKNFRKALGLGYRVGWYAWEELGGRVENCNISSYNESWIEGLENIHAVIQNDMSQPLSFEEFSGPINHFYHGDGHVLIGEACSTGEEDGPMSYSEVSARDPIFYRWHTHLENLMQEFRDKKLPRYTREDFQLSDDIKVMSVNTILEDGRETQNILTTHFEEAKIEHDAETPITYNRINHINYKYQIHIRNPKRVTKKVFIRLWLGILSDENDISSYDPKYMIEMDQFVINLSYRRPLQTFERLSGESAATMKDVGSTIKSLMADITNKTETRTWCGLPHNLLVPRAADFKPDGENLGGTNFVLLAFVTDVDQDVTTGSDGVEHMLCGHKHLNTKLDEKPFGFPFDRQISFKLNKTDRFVSSAIVKLIHRPARYKQSEVVEKINVIKDETTNNINGFTKSENPDLMRDDASKNITGFSQPKKVGKILDDDSDGIIDFVKPKETDLEKNVTLNNNEISEEALRKIVAWIRDLAAQENMRKQNKI